ncbi:proton channel OtopLc isoform X1 [Daphnia magna]|uniref:proton channel OtopLc isoform X1 n=1 Tax=Daphnia magna TaxID=35525 RepID=UPI001E1BC487|nr:proton channel OtopLc isoform X1 [Daphnia magna]XP_045026820.1 proton channel OtopLc isoform X1 [Daphnia magna]XP_045026821.1 proton channel OtopLc isoform X1 [Daphnia magna]XP_045026822.1 proton channel OtopLc isoform X1 [Daphnia magna]XP_045026823.1 proton channel OtopLc isoform X1 [Daphnia magna]XP_045026824.1 proton channel OtopLc isoform X1 [Daphnia magna]
MQAIELTPLMNNVLATDLECTVTDVVEANESQRRVPSSNSLASLSAMESAPRSNRPEEKEMVASIRVYEPDCDAGLFETSLQLNKNNQRRASVQRLGHTVEQDDASVEMMENKTTSRKRYSFTRCNNVSHFRRLQSTSRCGTRDGTPMPSTLNVATVPQTLSIRWKERGDNALLTVISALYAKLLVVMGLAFPMTEVISNHVPSFSYLGFYLYLYFGSIAYFLFVFFTMLKNRAAKGNRYFGCGSIKSPKVLELKDMTDCCSEESPPRAMGKMSSQHYGSFYLRIGAVAFGVGSMIYSGLEFAQYFETDPGSKCHNILMAATPAARMVFTFIQMYFIFLNAKMAVYCKPRAIAYFGLMHIVATNLCVWLNVIIEETKHEILHQFSNHDSDSSGHHDQSSSQKSSATVVKRHAEAVFEYTDTVGDSSLVDECKRSDMMGNVVQDASQFLFPCAIEYSLICAAILYVMWKNVSMDDNDEIYKRSNSGGSAAGRRSRHQYSVDCAKANKGLFAGIFILVGTIISLVLFFALINNPNFRALAIMEVAVSRLLLFCLAFFATLLGIFQIRELEFDSSRHFGLDAVLLVVAQIGLMAYKLFTVIACCYSVKTEDDENSTLVLFSALAALFQAVTQTLFILDASRRHTYTADQQSRKPGREVVTFLLMCNFAMWTVNTLEKSRADANPLQLEFFGLWPWIIIMNVSMPLTIFYRFHSTVVLCEIWKRCYKVKPDFI